MHKGFESSGDGARAVPFFDAHCDTVMQVVDGRLDFSTGEGERHVSYSAMQAGGVRAQIFAAYVLSKEHPGREAERVDAMIRAVGEMADVTQGGMEVARTAADVRRAFQGGPIAAILGIEGADCLEGRAENLRRYASDGVRDLIFAWADNPFSGTTFGSGGPLSREGERLLGLAEELHVMVDVSHLSDAAFACVCRASTRPFVASHSNCRSICPSPRNLTDEMIRSVADAGGVMGDQPRDVVPRAVDVSRDRPSTKGRGAPGSERRGEIAPTSPRSWRFLDPILSGSLAMSCTPFASEGEDCVGMGGDLDGIYQTPAGLGGVADYPRIVDVLRSADLTERQIEKVSHGNFLRVYGEVLP